MKELEEVLEEAKELVLPSPEEEARLSQIAEKVLGIVKEAVSEDDEIKVLLGGSFAKGTWLKGEADLDIFVQLPTDRGEEELIKYGVELPKKALSSFPSKLRYAEHPYLEVFLEDVRINVVPCYAVRKGEWRSAADRSPYHTSFVSERMGEEERNQTRLLKKFLKAAGIYGAEIRTKGFSGYVCEVMVMALGPFVKVLEAAQSFKPPQLIALEAPSYDAKKVHKSPLIILDPVDPRRNLGAAISARSLGLFMARARSFLEHPSVDFFHQKRPRLELLEMRNEGGAAWPSEANLLLIAFEHYARSIDVLWGQLERSLKGLVRQLRLMGFGVVRSLIASDGERRSALLFLLDGLQLPEWSVRDGPPSYSLHHSSNFVEQNLRSSPLIWIEEDGRLRALVRRKFRSAEEVAVAAISGDLETAIAPGLREELKKARVFAGTLRSLLTGPHEKLMEEVLRSEWLREALAKLVGGDWDHVANPTRRAS